ncbi:tetratricopeptide repeat protein [Embleya sp. NPDC059237]|uniref:tetratricopeptide repeat protein n=1 Tax=Embleya sp. NPDC059237 TaxID=3346784 RepID=UPI00367DCC4C
MDAEDLDSRTRTQSGCIPPHLVTRLLELGHHEMVEAWAADGEWFCAREHARSLTARDGHAEALRVLDPYVATGWWTAAEAAAEVLEGWGKAEEAIALVRPHTEGGGSLELAFCARLLARHARADEAFSLLAPHVAEWIPAAALVEVAAVAGRDEDAADLLTARIRARYDCDHCGSPSCGRGGLTPWNALELLAEIRERQGRIDDAVALLRNRATTSVNNRDRLADLLARHDRLDELADYARVEHHGHAAACLVEWLEERGDVEGAITVLRNRVDARTGFSHPDVHLARFLERHGRVDEAITVMRALVDDHSEDWTVSMLCTLYTDHGRAREGLAHLDDLLPGQQDWEFFRSRITLLAACGLHEEAIAQARAHPEGDSSYAAWTIAEVLADAGRPEEAVTELERHPTANSEVLARYLIDLGRIEEAVAHLRRPRPRPLWPAATTDTDTPPF